MNELNSLIKKTLDLPLLNMFWDGYSALKVLMPENFLFFCKRHHRNEIINVHHRHAISFYLQGDAELIVEGTRQTVKPGHVAAFLPHQSHGHLDSGDVVHLYLTFEAPAGAYEELRDKVLKITPEIQYYLEKALSCYMRESDPMQIQRCYLLIQLILLELLEASKSIKTPEESTSTSPISQAIHYVFKNLDTSLKIDDIASFCGLSESHLRKLFREHMKMSIGQWIKVNRLNRSKTLLITTELSIKEIAYECGYQTPSRFCDNFKTYTSMTPREFRKANMLT